MAAETTELAKNVIAFLLTGIGSTVLFLMPGYLLGTTMDRGRQGPALSERAFIANVHQWAESAATRTCATQLWLNRGPASARPHPVADGRRDGFLRQRGYSSRAGVPGRV